MKIEQRNKLIERAKSRKDGVYSYRGFLYAVKDNKFIAFADYFGAIYAVQGVFNVKAGECEQYERKGKLLEYLKSLK